jgi:hypothetical protein
MARCFLASLNNSQGILLVSAKSSKTSFRKTHRSLLAALIYKRSKHREYNQPHTIFTPQRPEPGSSLSQSHHDWPARRDVVVHSSPNLNQ